MSLANNSHFTRAPIDDKDNNERYCGIGRQMSWPDTPIELPPFSPYVIIIVRGGSVV